MPAALFLPLLLRLAGPLAFVCAVLIAGALNRSFILVPVLVLAATATTILIRMVSPSPVTDLKAAMTADPNAPAPSVFRGTGRRLAFGLVGYGILFGIAALIAALFQTTEFEPQLRSDDFWFVVIPAMIAVCGAWISARLGVSQMANMMEQMQGMFAEMQARQAGDPGSDDAFTVEGEIIDPPDRDS